MRTNCPLWQLLTQCLRSPTPCTRFAGQVQGLGSVVVGKLPFRTVHFVQLLSEVPAHSMDLVLSRYSFG